MTTSATADTTNVAKLAKRPEKLSGADQEHGAERRAEQRCADHQHRSNDHLHTDSTSTTVPTDAVPK